MLPGGKESAAACGVASPSLLSASTLVSFRGQIAVGSTMSSSGEAKSSAPAPPRAGRAEAGAAVDGPGEAAGGKQATALLVLGMAGSGKTSFVQRLNAHLHMAKKPCYIINLDPAVSAHTHAHVPAQHLTAMCHSARLGLAMRRQSTAIHSGFLDSSCNHSLLPCTRTTSHSSNWPLSLDVFRFRPFTAREPTCLAVTFVLCQLSSAQSG